MQKTKATDSKLLAHRVKMLESCHKMVGMSRLVEVMKEAKSARVRNCGLTSDAFLNEHGRHGFSNSVNSAHWKKKGWTIARILREQAKASLAARLDMSLILNMCAELPPWRTLQRGERVKIVMGAHRWPGPVDSRNPLERTRVAPGPDRGSSRGTTPPHEQSTIGEMVAVADLTAADYLQEFFRLHIADRVRCEMQRILSCSAPAATQRLVEWRCLSPADAHDAISRKGAEHNLGAVIAIGSPYVNPITAPLATAILGGLPQAQLPVMCLLKAINLTPGQPLFRSVHAADESRVCIDEHFFAESTTRVGRKTVHTDVGIVLVDSRRDLGAVEAPIRVICAGLGALGTLGAVKALCDGLPDSAGDDLPRSGFTGTDRWGAVVTVRSLKRQPSVEELRDDAIVNISRVVPF